MKFVSSVAVTFALVALASSRPVVVKRDIDPALIPQFGVQPGVNPTGTGDCDGITNPQGKVVKIPCSCPPDRNSFIESLKANVAAGHAVNNPSVSVTFPQDNTPEAEVVRIQASIITLQNLKGPGVGCPAASTTFSAQLQAAQNRKTLATRDAAPSVDEALIPDFGHAAGLNPDGHGNCDGITNAQGQVVKIPCSCPPEREAFVDALKKNVAAGEAVNNPSIRVSFPTGNTKEAVVGRIQAAIVTLQNLNGPGKGCPAASTTFSAQLLAAQQ